MALTIWILKRTIFVVEEQVDLGKAERLAAGTAPKDYVLTGLGAKLASVAFT